MTTHELADSVLKDHLFLCHADGSQCSDGCDKEADPNQLRNQEDECHNEGTCGVCHTCQKQHCHEEHGT